MGMKFEIHAHTNKPGRQSSWSDKTITAHHAWGEYHLLMWMTVISQLCQKAARNTLAASASC